MHVLIVGAGPSGLACAKSILTYSLDSEVTVVDKKLKIGVPQRCAGGISAWMMNRIGVHIPSNAIATKVRVVRIYAPGGHYWELGGDKDYGFVLNRDVFEREMTKDVERLGGEVVLAHLVSSRDLEFWQSQYDYIVGADGYPSVVRDWLRFKLPSYPIPLEDTHIGVQKTIMTDYPQNMIKLYFGQKVAPRGYAWLFPGGGNLVRAGLGIPLSERVDTGELLNHFVNGKVRDYREVESIAKLIPTAKMPETGVYGKVILVGDALPSTDPLTGGGICQGIASGKAAGKAIAEGNPELYDRYIGWLRTQNSRRYRLKKVLYSFTDQDFNDLIEVMRGFKPKSMSVGKELRRAVLHLLLRKPSLLRKFSALF